MLTAWCPARTVRDPNLIRGLVSPAQSRWWAANISLQIVSLALPAASGPLTAAENY